MLAGLVGFLVNGTHGIIKGRHPIVSALSGGIYTFTLGTTLWTAREIVVRSWKPDRQYTPRELTMATALGFGVGGGAVSAAFRSRAHFVPGLLVFSITGALGQGAVNAWDARRQNGSPNRDGFWMRIAKSSYSPVTVWSDDEYANVLREKMLKLDVEIAILDDKIAALREQQQQETLQPTSSEASNAGSP